MLKNYFKQICTVFFVLLAPIVAQAENFDYRFDVRLGVAKIGEMRVRASNDGAQYRTSASLFTTGLVGAVYDVRYDYTAEGLVGDTALLTPTKYRAVNDEKNRTTSLDMLYSGSKIASITFTPTREIPAESLSHRGTVDPMTLIYFLLRPATTASVCKGQIDLFDGESLAHVSFGTLRRKDDGRVECSISYSSSGGGGMALSSLVFIPDSNGMMRISSFVVESSIGKLHVKSR